MRWIPSLLAFFLLSGCAAGVGYRNYEGSDRACISGSPGFASHVALGQESAVSISAIDDNAGLSFPPYCFTPGKHTLQVRASFGEMATNGSVEFEFAPAQTYVLRAYLSGISFVFRLVNTTKVPETEVSEASMKANTSIRFHAQGIPIFIK